MADQTDDALIREINEDLREEQMKKLWQRYGGYVVGVALLIVVIVAGYQGWKQYDISTRSSEGEQFHTALQLVRSGNDAQAMAAMRTLSEDASTGYGVLAQFQEAALLAKQGDAPGAASLYKQIARENTGNVALSGLANILGVMVEVNAGGYDRLALELRLAAIAEDSHPYRHSAWELLGVIALDAGDAAKAREAFAQLANDASAPQGLRERAVNLLQNLGS